MKLSEEKQIIIVSVISLIFILLPSIYVQILDGKLQDFQNSIELKQLDISNYTNTINFWQNELIKTQVTKIMISHGGHYVAPHEEYINSMNYPELIDIMNEYKQNKITPQDHIYKLSQF